VQITLRCALLLAAAAPASAFSDPEFCIVAQQLATATQGDVGVWIDRQTRNAGMAVSCDRRTVEFTRFTYAPSVSMDQAWQQRKAADWNAVHCASPVWSEAVRSGWKVVLIQASADGGRVTIAAECGK
jgi:hypothetical protein